MSVTIDINGSQRSINAEKGTTLLDALVARDIYLPSACGGRAICGQCKVKVLSGAGPVTKGEERLLSLEERRDGIRLACQVRTDADLSLDIPVAQLETKKHPGRVVSIRDLTHDTKEIGIKLRAGDAMPFQAGQFAQFVLPGAGPAGEMIIRTYSMASPPSRPVDLEFNVRLVPNGAGSTYIHTRVREGDDLELIGPMGEFHLRERDATMICIAGGSGMAPVKSILLDMRERRIVKRAVWFFFGAVTRKDLFYIDLFRDLEKSWPGFHFVPALSGPEPGDGWTGETGLIPDVVERHLAGTIDRSAPVEAYLCGGPGFLNASLKMLDRSGVAKENIHFDRFV
jgi:Na+-transporting NADH:ubiquinone oxidoreductase subunit F